MVIFILVISCGLAYAKSPVMQMTAEEKERLKSLSTLPYLQGYFSAPELTGVIRYNRALSNKGLTLYASGHDGAAYLIDMIGHVLHEWHYKLKDIWPELVAKKIAPFWENIYLYENGDLLAIYNHGGIIKLDKDSNLLWAYKCPAHHDIDVDENGFIYTLTDDEIQPREGLSALDNSILILNPEGEPVRKISFLNAMQNSKVPEIQEYFKRVLGIILNGGEDVFHGNTLEILNGRAAESNPAFKKGNILVCMLTISSIGVIDPVAGEMVWMLGPKIWFEGQHNPNLLDNGNILIFDNHFGGSKTQSRVLEFDSQTLQHIWSYMDEGFYTDTHGTNVRLDNGNTLVVESNTGRIFELTMQGAIVWEFLNPHTTGEDNDLIAAVFAAYRIAPPFVSSWLDVEEYQRKY